MYAPVLRQGKWCVVWRYSSGEQHFVAAYSDVDEAKKAAARALQLMKIKEPVTPQSWPEIAHIGGDGRALPPHS